MLFSNYKTPAMLPILYLKKLVAGSAAAIMYYVFIYIEFTLLIPLIDKLSKSNYKYIGFMVAPMEIICMRLIPLLTGCEVNRYLRVIIHISCFGWFTYYYLGYLLGNNILSIGISTGKLVCLWAGSIVLQIAEGYWYLSMGEVNCGTQLKLSALLTGTLFVIIAHRVIISEKPLKQNLLRLLGDCSFGIYFSHSAVMAVLAKLPYYSQYVRYPINAIIAVLLSLICVQIGQKFLGPYGKYLAL